ncbi:MAG: hypothetical protein QOG53_1683 [Frankiales bacterium]|nr:hypothetical protein [Frankiales bacterium]
MHPDIAITTSPVPTLARPLPRPTLPPVPLPTLTGRSPSSPATARPSSSLSSTVWKDSFAGWTVTTKRNVAKPRAGQLVHFVATIVPPRSGIYQVTVLWGDNMGSTNPVVSSCESGPHAQAGHAFVVAFDHAWRIGRLYTVTVQPNVGCAAGPSPKYPKHQLLVQPGPLRGNGPQRPWGRIVYNGADQGDPSKSRHFSAQGQDNDGYVARFIFDWGDGSKATTVDFLSQCRRPPDDAWIEYPNSVNDVAHTFANDPSSYVISMTVVSSGCRGEDAQRTTVRWRPSQVESGPYTSPEPRP